MNLIQIMRNQFAYFQSYSMMRLLLLLSVLILPSAALAGGSAPWCHIINEDEYCSFKTAESCYKRAASGGSCRENPRIVGVQGERRWCVVSASGRNCNYGGQRSCLRAAQSMNGGCVVNTEKILKFAKRGGLKNQGRSPADLAAELAEANAP